MCVLPGDGFRIAASGEVFYAELSHGRLYKYLRSRRKANVKTYKMMHKKAFAPSLLCHDDKKKARKIDVKSGCQ